MPVMKRIIQAGGILSLLLILSTPVRAQHIDSISPENPVQGESFEIVGSGFGDQQGPWVVEVYRVVNRQYLVYHFPVLRWRADHILVEVPDDIPINEYSVMVRIPNRLRGSNAVRMIIRKRAPNKSPQSVVPWIRRLHVTSQAELLIYGLNFGQLGGGWPPHIPQGGRALFTGNGRTEDLRVIRWLNGLVRVELPAGCEPGTYYVVISRGTGRANESNSMSFVLRPEMVGEAHPGSVSGFMRIDSAEPTSIPHGTLFTILGDHFDVYRKGKHDSLIRIGQGDRVVELVDVYKGRARAHACTIVEENPAEYPEYLDQGTLQWFNDHIVAIAPSELEPGRYLLRLLDKSDNRSSNTIVVKVVKGPRE